MDGVDALILAAHPESPVSVIPLLAEHLIAAGGKRLRPLLTVAAARLAGGQGDAALKLAAAVEFSHTATLLHDDVVDSSQLRRGRVAAHLIWGAPSSVLVGDFLFARAFELMVETGSSERRSKSWRARPASSPRARCCSRPARATSKLYAGDLPGHHQPRRPSCSPRRREGRRGLGPARTRRSQALRDYGQSLGLAFQLADDALDDAGSAETLGKNAGADFREGKATLPLILAISRTGARESEFWERVIGRKEQTEADFAPAPANW